LAEAISKMWSDQSAYKKMSENGHKLMEEDFNKDQQFNYFLKYFYQLCEKR
jgi:hypothetical protein